MRSDSGFTLFELLVAVALIAILSAVSLPVLSEGVVRNSVWTASEMIGSQVRQARLKAISRNTPFRVDFDCPVVGQFRVLVVTGDPLVDDDADRCSTTLEYDSGIFAMPTSVSYGDALPTLEVNGRGMYSAIGGAVPVVITIGYGGRTFRSITVSATGQISFETY